MYVLIVVSSWYQVVLSKKRIFDNLLNKELVFFTGHQLSKSTQDMRKVSLITFNNYLHAPVLNLMQPGQNGSINTTQIYCSF